MYYINFLLKIGMKIILLEPSFADYTYDDLCRKLSSLIPRPYLSRGKGSGESLGLAGAGCVRHQRCVIRYIMLKQIPDLIGRQGFVGNSNLYSKQWHCCIPVVGESYDCGNSEVQAQGFCPSSPDPFPS